MEIKEFMVSNEGIFAFMAALKGFFPSLKRFFLPKKSIPTAEGIKGMFFQPCVIISLIMHVKIFYDNDPKLEPDEDHYFLIINILVRIYNNFLIFSDKLLNFVIIYLF